MSQQFGADVYQQAQALIEQGKDANLSAKILCDADPKGCNYGIGIVLTGDGKPMGTAKTLLEYVAKEVDNSKVGTYMNSNAKLEELKKAVLKWQRIPESYAGNLALGLPSDAGTGAVRTAIELSLMLSPSTHTLGVEELGWPAYKAMAAASRVGFKQFPQDNPIDGDGILPLYQSGPMNTTGLVPDLKVTEERAKAAAKRGTGLILDRAYSGFEFASKLASSSYDEIMRLSFERQIKPYLENGVAFCMALSPTKAFASFALRPCGLLLVYCPDASKMKDVTAKLNGILRARGSSFEHIVTRALAKTFVQDLDRLEGEHQAVLERIAEAEGMWRKHAKGTAIEYLFSDQYAGLFRNPKAKEGAAVSIYNEHLYPVFSAGRCRLNVTGIPADDTLAGTHVKVFAEQCL